MQVMALQTGDYQAVKEKRDLGQTLCMFQGLSMIQIQNLSDDTVWGLDTGLRCDRSPGRYGCLDISWDWVQELDMGMDPDMNWD